MKTKNCRLGIFAVALCSVFACIAATAQADTVGITGTSPLSGLPGDTLTVTGDLTNSDPSNAYYFVADEFPSLDPALINPNDLIITNAAFGFGPASLDPAGSLSGVDLFTLQIASGVLPGSYGGVFQLYGDTDGSNCSPGSSGCLLLSTLDFTVNVASPVATPEPGTILLVCSGLAGLWLIKLHKSISLGRLS